MIFDIVVLIVLLISAGIAFMRGFIRETLTIAGVLGGLAASYFGAPLLIPYMRGWMGVVEGEEPQRLFDILPYDVLADVLSYGAIFITVVIVLSIVSHMLAEAARSVGLGAVDRTLGFIFGLVRGVLLLGLLYLPVYLFIDKDARETWFKDSKTNFYLEKTADAMASFLPEDAAQDAEEAMKKAGEANGMREKLQGIDLLNGGKVEDLEESETDKPAGYQEDFRQQMDELFEEKSGQMNE